MAEAQERGQAERSCRSCRKLKRKCSKDLPTCTLCRRVGRVCQYYDLEEPSTKNDDISALQRRIDHLESLLSNAVSPGNVSSSATTLTPTRGLMLDETVDMINFETQVDTITFPMLFLDSVACRNRNIPQELGRAMSEVAFPLPVIQDVEQIVQHYYSTTHLWLPIVSLIRIKRILNNSALRNAADAQVLFMAMDLISNSTPRSDSATTSLYQTIKSMIVYCEMKSLLSLNLVAARLLLALYEIGHALYPAAYMTVGSCVRMAYLLGLHDQRRALQIFQKPNTWTEGEERSRLWWATIILDRCVTIGFRFRPLSVSSIPPGEIIAADDDSWDRGSPSVNPMLVMSVDSTLSVSYFARMCQAAHLLGRVIQHINPEPGAGDIDHQFRFQEALQIHRAASSFLSIINEEYLAAADDIKIRLCPARALAYSALLNLYDHHCCIGGDMLDPGGDHNGIRVELQSVALGGLKILPAEVVSFAREMIKITSLDGPGLDKLCPLACEALYQAAGNYAWNYRETVHPDLLASLETLRGFLGEIAPRWGIAGEYLRLLVGTEFEWKGGCRF